MKVVIVPGNGVFRSNWYGWLYDELNKTHGITCVLENMPDPLMAREKIWIPFMRDTLACDDQTVIVGHSSGAQAAMRFAESHKIKGIVLIFDVFRSNWYGWLYDELNKTHGITCVLENMPDPLMAREKIWIPFMRDTLACDDQTVIVGHSSGAQAAMRFAESHKIKGIVLISACVTDLGMDSERKSGYYNRPWNWERIQQNTDFILQFGSTDDPFIPWLEQQQVADGLKSDLHKFEDKGHFMCSQFPALLEAIKSSISYMLFLLCVV